MKNYIVITGGCGFIGSNLIKFFLKKTKFNLISIDNYSSGSPKNHIFNKRVKYINCHTKKIFNKLSRYKNKIETIFHFGEFSRIHQSFFQINECIESNILGTASVFNFCLKNNIRLIYSATSASLGNKGKDRTLSPYALTKSTNLELLKYLNLWFGLRYEALYFYNVYGPGQIQSGRMATLIGIFERQFLKNKMLTVCKPGTQSRKFTHIDDTINGCFVAWKKNKNYHYSMSNLKSYSVLQVAKMFKSKIKFINPRLGEREKSTILEKIDGISIHKIQCKRSLSDYIKNFIKIQHN